MFSCKAKVIRVLFVVLVSLVAAAAVYAQTIVEQDTVTVTARVADDNTIIFSGDACPNCQVFLLLGGVIEDTSTALADGSFQLSIEDISAGTHQFGVYAIDRNSVQSGTSSFSASVSQGALVLVSDILVPPTLQTDKSRVAKGTNITLSGYAVPAGDVTIDVDNGGRLIQVTSAADGEYFYQLDTKNMQIGTHSAQSFVETATATSGDSLLVEFEVVKKKDDEEDDEEESSKTTCEEADYNDNDKVNIVDFSILVYHYESPNVPDDIDLNEDDDVDLQDFSILIYCWTG